MRAAICIWALIGVIGFARSSNAQTPQVAPSAINSFDQGLRERGLGHLDSAVAAFSKALTIDPSYRSAHFQRGEVFLQELKLDSAIADLTTAIRIEPDTAAYTERGLAYYRKGDYGRAIADFTSAINQGGDAKLAWFRRGIVYFHLGNFANSEGDFDQARRLGVSPVDVANVYLLNLSLERAIAAYSEAIISSYNLDVVYLGRGQAEFFNGDIDAAIADFSRGSSPTSLNGNLTEMLALVHRAQGDEIDANANFGKLIEAFGTAIASAPQNANYWNRRCWVRASANVDLPLALEDCNTAIKLAPYYAAAIDSRAFVNFKMGRFSAALVDYNDAIKKNPSQFQSYFMRGVTKIRLGQSKSGKADIVLAKKYRPSVEKEFALYGVTP